MDGNQPARGLGPCLVVLEDDDDYRMILRRVLEPLARQRGWASVFLGAVAEGEAILGSTSVDLLISDYHLQDGLGTVVARAAQELQPDSRRILLTSDAVSARQAWQNEPDVVDEVWDKPWDPRLVAKRVASCMDAIEDEAWAARATTS